MARNAPTNLPTLRDRLVDIDGVVESPSMFRDDRGFWVNGKEIAHFEEPGVIDIRLTRAVIREAKERLADNPLVQVRTTGSDWVVVDASTADGESLALELAERAAAAHRAPAGTVPAPPPTGGRLRSLRRFR